MITFIVQPTVLCVELIKTFKNLKMLGASHTQVALYSETGMTLSLFTTQQRL